MTDKPFDENFRGFLYEKIALENDKTDYRGAIMAKGLEKEYHKLHNVNQAVTYG